MNEIVTHNSLLLDDRPLVILPKLAMEVGVTQAVILQQFHYWLQRSTNVRDGYRWIYNSYSEWSKQFPFWSLSKLKRAILNLEKNGYLITGNYNEAGFDKTKWYRINYEKLIVDQPLAQNEPTNGSNRYDASVQNDPTNTIDYQRVHKRLQQQKTTTTKNNHCSEDEKSKSKDKHEDDIQRLIDDYEANISPNVTGYLIEDIQQEYEDWAKTDSEHAKDIILLAYRIAVENGVHKWNYVKSILNNWYQGNLTTLVKIKAQQAIKAKQSSSSEPHVLSNKDKMKNKNRALDAIKEQRKREAQAFNRLGEIDE